MAAVSRRQSDDARCGAGMRGVAGHCFTRAQWRRRRARGRPDAKPRIIKAAERLEYRRSPRVRADPRDPTAIGLIIDELMASPFAAPLMEGAREAAWEYQCVVEMILNSE